MSYYYLIASLPALSMQQEPISHEDFQLRCDAELTARDRKTMKTLTQMSFIDTETNNAFINTWNNCETQLRNAIAKTRAAKRHVDPARVLRTHGGFTTQIEDAVENAWTQPSPLAREHNLDTLRWSLLDTLQGHDPFSFNVLLAYAVKRQIAQRWSSMDPDAGWKHAQQQFEQQPAGTNRPDQPETAGSQTGT